MVISNFFNVDMYYLNELGHGNQFSKNLFRLYYGQGTGVGAIETQT